MTSRLSNGPRAILAGCLCLLGLVDARTWAAEPMEVYRFGTAAVNDRLTNQFLLRNGGGEPLIVESVTPSCECVKVMQWPTNVAAGATGIVEIVFAPDKAGAVDYRVLVKTSTPDRPEIEFAIQGEVTAAPRLRLDRDWALYLGTDEAQKVLEDPGSAFWVDVRSEEAHARARIPGAIQIPLYAVKTKGFLRNRRVVLVDEGFGSQALDEECRKLRGMGFSGVSLWYGGMNAWRRRGGVLEGNGLPSVHLVPPIAMNDIAYSTDWLVVLANGAATNAAAEAVAIPFETSKKEEFVSALNAAIEARPQVASVLIATATGEDYGAMAELADKINAFVFFLEGGRAAWEAHREMMGAMQNSRTAVVQSMGEGGVRVRPGGCGGCPK